MQQDTQLLIRVPKDLKGAFEGLCKSRGVKVSEALRSFMAAEVLQSATDVKTGEGKQPPVKAKRTTSKPSHPKGAPQASEPSSLGEKCPDTMDLFDSPRNAQERTGAKVIPLEVQGYQKGFKDANKGKIDVNKLIADMQANKVKKKRK